MTRANGGAENLQQTLIKGKTFKAQVIGVASVIEGYNNRDDGNSYKCFDLIQDANAQFSLVLSNGLGTTKITLSGYNGSIGLGSSAIDSKAIITCTSTTQGVLLPRMTTTQRDAITSPPEGLLIYNLTTHTLQVYNGTAWANVPG